MKTARDIKASLEKGRRTSVNITYMTLHVIMLALSIFLVISISIDSFKGDIFYGEPRFMKTQLWICIVFLVDFFIEFFMAKRKWHYLYTHFVFSRFNTISTDYPALRLDILDQYNVSVAIHPIGEGVDMQWQ